MMAHYHSIKKGWYNVLYIFQRAIFLRTKRTKVNKGSEDKIQKSSLIY